MDKHSDHGKKLKLAVCTRINGILDINHLYILLFYDMRSHSS